MNQITAVQTVHSLTLLNTTLQCDKEKDKNVPTAAELTEFCLMKNFCGWFETSAKDNINIEQATRFLVSAVSISAIQPSDIFVITELLDDRTIRRKNLSRDKKNAFFHRCFQKFEWKEFQRFEWKEWCNLVISIFSQGGYSQ